MMPCQPIRYIARQFAPEGSSLNDWGHRISPLHRAAGAGDIDKIKALLAAGADPNAEDAFGDTPLHWAGRNAYADAILVLLSNEEQAQGDGKRLGADPNKQNHKGETALMLVADVVTSSDTDNQQAKAAAI